MKSFLAALVMMFAFVSISPAQVNVLGVYASVTPTSATNCPNTFTFTGNIRYTGQGVIKYQWKRSDGAIAPIQTLTLNGSGSQAVTTTWTLGLTYNGWEALHVWFDGGEKESNQATFSLVCGNDNPNTKKPDLACTKGKGVVFGGEVGGSGGTFVPWGGTINLNPATALPVGCPNANGACAFNVTYYFSNIGTGDATTPFENKLVVDAATNPAVALNGSTCSGVYVVRRRVRAAGLPASLSWVRTSITRCSLSSSSGL